MKFVRVKNITTQAEPSIQAELCDSFMSRFWGLMFRKSLGDGAGILLVESSESRLNTSIHMFFMSFDIGVVWIDSSGQIVDTTIAQRWKPYYAPRSPARYTLETLPDQLKNYHIGDTVEFVNVEN